MCTISLSDPLHSICWVILTVIWNLLPLPTVNSHLLPDLGPPTSATSNSPINYLLLSVQGVTDIDDVFHQIYIGGPTLARGYLNRPELNKTRFIPRPEGLPKSVPDRLYKAGDWGYLLTDGSFEICGRCDSMVKIRGYSIETQVCGHV